MAYEWLCLHLNYAFGWHGYVSAANLAFRRNLFPGYDRELTQGGDELYVLKNLKKTGRVSYRFINPITTSSRRLHQGFSKIFFGDFLGAYLINYLCSQVTGKKSWGSYESHRHTDPLSNRNLHIGSSYVFFLMLMLFVLTVTYAPGSLLLDKFQTFLSESALL